MRLAMAMFESTMPHLVFTLLLAAALSVVVALLGRRSRRERLYHAVWVVVACMVTVVGSSWAMFWIHG